MPSDASPGAASFHSGKLQIPANLTQKWQSATPSQQAKEPLARRPKTACAPCRSAKVKCHQDGQSCTRCIERGLSCRPTASTRQTSPDTTMTTVATTATPSRKRPRAENASICLDDTAEQPSDDDQTGQYSGPDFPQLFGDASTWATTMCDPFHQHAQRVGIDWSAVDSVIDWEAAAAATANFDLFSPGMLNDAPGTSLNPGSMTTATSANTPTSSSRDSNEQPSPQGARSTDCQCRTGLTQRIPKAQAALRAERLDLLFATTESVVQHCRDVVDCKDCNVTCSDLIYLMAVFQEIDPCFEYMAKGVVDQPITVTMGEYTTMVGSSRARAWHRIFVVELFHKVDAVLEAIGARREAIIAELRPTCRLGRVNSHFLDTVIKASRDNFDRILSRLDGEPE